MKTQTKTLLAGAAVVIGSRRYLNLPWNVAIISGLAVMAGFLVLTIGCDEDPD